MMKKTLFMAAIAALALSSCSKDTPAAGTSAETGTAISFRTTINKTDFADTKVAHANSLLNNFTLFARKWSTLAPSGSGSTTVKGEGFDFMNFFTVARQQNTNLPTLGETYVYYPLKHFPSSPANEGISFFAYSPAGSRLISNQDAKQPHLVNFGTSSQMQFDYTVPMNFTEQGANQEDFLVASYKQSSTSAAASAAAAAVKLNFVHPLSSISFAAQNGSNSTGFVAHKIELINFDNVGTLTMSAPSTEAAVSTLTNFVWTNNTPQEGNIYTFNMLGYDENVSTNLSGAYIAPMSNNVEQISELTSGNEHMMMLPQDFSNFLDPNPPYHATLAPTGTKPLGVNIEPSDLSTRCYIKITFSSFEGDMNWIYKRAVLYLRMPNPEWGSVYPSFSVYPSVFEKGKLYKFTYRFDANAAGSPITIGEIKVLPWTPDGLTVPNP